MKRRIKTVTRNNQRTYVNLLVFHLEGLSGSFHREHGGLRVLDRLNRKRRLFHVECLPRHLVPLLLVHFFPLERFQCPPLDALGRRPFRTFQLVLEFNQLPVEVADLLIEGADAVVDGGRRVRESGRGRRRLGFSEQTVHDSMTLVSSPFSPQRFRFLIKCLDRDRRGEANPIVL